MITGLLLARVPYLGHASPSIYVLVYVICVGGVRNHVNSYSIHLCHAMSII